MDLTLLKTLCTTHGVSGDTGEIIAVIKKELDALGISSEQTGYGTLICGNTKNPKKLISGHIDEVGFQITKIEEDGKIRILPVGWVFANRLDHAIIYINANDKQVRGSIFHQEVLKTENLEHFGTIFVDVGANTKKEIEAMGIAVGQTGSYQKEYFENNGTVIATSMDNRVSPFAMLEILKHDKSVLKGNMFAFVTDEEMFDHSANGLGDQFKPDFVAVLDFCPLHQKPGEEDITGEINKGPVVCYRGGSHILHEDVRKYFDTKIKSPFQKSFFSPATLHQLEPVNFQNNGHTKAVNVCMPGFGYHGGVYTIRKADLEGYIKLTQEILKTPF